MLPRILPCLWWLFGARMLAVTTTTTTTTVQAFVLPYDIHHGASSGHQVDEKTPNKYHSSFRPRSRRSLSAFADDEPENSQFGRQDYWNQVYEEQSSFSWYAGWEDLQPFVDEFLQEPHGKDSRVLLPGVGNDATLVDMYDDGYHCLTAMDYAPEGIERCREMLGPSRRVREGRGGTGVELVVADARDLGGVFEDDRFDAVLEKGTLDAIYLSGGRDKEKALKNMEMAIKELGRCLRPGGIWISIAAVVDSQIQACFDAKPLDWSCLVKQGDLFVTEDGFTSNNIDGSLLVWRKK